MGTGDQPKPPQAPNQKLLRVDEELRGGEVTSSSTAVASTKAKAKRMRPKTTRAIDKSTPPAAGSRGRPQAFDGVLVDSPRRPPRQPTVAPASLLSPTITHNDRGKREREHRSVDQDSEAAEVDQGLQDAGVEGEHAYSGKGSDEDGFPDDQFEEPPDSEEERIRLLGIGRAERAFTPAEHGEISSNTYSRALGEALKELTPEPTHRHSRVPSPASEGTEDSFEPSTSSEEYMSGLKDALSAETDAKQRARLEQERATKLKAREDKARQYADEQAQWRQATKGKGREVEDGDDKEGEMPKPMVTRLTKAQTEAVKQLAEEERERFGQLARKMQVPVELVLEVAHRQTGKSRGGPWNDWLRLYAAEHPEHGVSCISRPYRTVLITHPGLNAHELSELYSKEKMEACNNGKDGFEEWGNNNTLRLEELEGKLNRRTFSGSSRSSIVTKTGKRCGETVSLLCFSWASMWG